jgi:hypothetical protein
LDHVETAYDWLSVQNAKIRFQLAEDIELSDNGPRVRVYTPKAAAEKKDLPIGL